MHESKSNAVSTSKDLWTLRRFNVDVVSINMGACDLDDNPSCESHPHASWYNW
jgi:hypothetical protein